jgi:hypothetical protein
MFHHLEINRTIAHDRRTQLVDRAANERLTFSIRRQAEPFVFSRRPSRHR